ncbi:MAG: insulinase family protein [Candidatus Dadabacteria bacterium]|nr:MAG: insulinase family protein [Candidatus Dadabacteria bacterium]
MPETIKITTLSNGLTVIVEEARWAESASYALIVPSGLLFDPEQNIGASMIVAELTSRGAGGLSAQELSNALDSLGARHTVGCGLFYTTYRGSLLGDRLEDALAITASMATEADLPGPEIDGIKALLEQEINSMYDTPSRRVMHELSIRYYPGVFARPSLGDKEGIRQTSIDTIRKIYRNFYVPEKSILSISGKVSADSIIKKVEALFGGWKGSAPNYPIPGEFPPRDVFHVSYDSTQLQIAVAFPSAALEDEDYYSARVLNGVLSGGMFGRLFVEVREKRGLCYSVNSSCSANGYYGVHTAYAGTTTERAQETLDVMMEIFKTISGTITEEELERSKANIKASLVMSEESTQSRAISNATDWWWISRIRTLEEIKAKIEEVDLKMTDNYAQKLAATEPMVVTLGEKELKLK